MIRTVVVLAALSVLVALAVPVRGVAAVPSADPTPATAGAVRGVTDRSVRVAGLGDALLYGGADVGARARFQRANDAGGVHGRTVDYVGFTDDGGDPAADAAAARKLVEQDGVFAVVPTVTPDLSAAPYLVEQRAPYFGWALSSNFCGTRYGFGFAGCPVPEHATSDIWPRLVGSLFPDGARGRAVAVIGEDTPSGRYEVRALTAAATSVRFRVPYAKATLAVPATADPDAVAKEILTSDAGGAPDAVFVVGSPSNVTGLRQALSANGYLGVVTDRIGYAPDLVAAAVGGFVFVPTAPVESAPDDAAMRQLVADVQKVAPGQAIDQAVVAGYWSADLFLAALQQAGAKLTPARLERATNRRFTYEVAGAVGPTTFPAAHALPTPCGALVSSTGTQYAVKVPYTCGRVVPVRERS